MVYKIGFLKNLCWFMLTKTYSYVIFGGAKRDRTADLLNAIQALSQLSYSPMSIDRKPDTMLLIIMSI